MYTALTSRRYFAYPPSEEHVPNDLLYGSNLAWEDDTAKNNSTDTSIEISREILA
jgi:hypothetical protein